MEKGVDPENSEKGGWDTRPLASYVETFYDSLQNNIYKIISRTKLRPLNLPLLLLNVTAPLGKLLLIQKFSSHSRAFMLVNQPLSCSISDCSLSWQK